MWYLDASAFLKLLVLEDESEAMRHWIAEHAPAWSSQLLLTEAMRSAPRLDLDRGVVLQALETVSLMMPSAQTFFVAGQLGPASLRTLDALHLASALELGSDLDGLVTYDDRLATAARASEIEVLAPR
jgi:predicted nucleic acid-binding protein